MSSTRTSSPYFSPNSIIAPGFCASSIGITRACGRRVVEDLGVDDRLDAADLVVGHRRVVREVEARLVGIDERALLLDVRAQHLAQRLVHQVRRRVVAHRARRARRGRPARRPCRRPRARPSSTSPTWPKTSGWIFCVSSTANSVRHDAALRELAAVADLAAGLGVERRRDRARRRRARRSASESHRRAVLVERDDAALLGQRVVAAERASSARVVELRARS